MTWVRVVTAIDNMEERLARTGGAGSLCLDSTPTAAFEIVDFRKTGSQTHVQPSHGCGPHVFWDTLMALSGVAFESLPPCVAQRAGMPTPPSAFQAIADCLSRNRH